MIYRNTLTILFPYTTLFRSIKVGMPFDRMGMDIVGLLPKTDRGNMYIVVATEYLTKWPEARALQNAKASSVVSFFYEDVICCQDRKSTRLNSSHLGISYAVF